MVPLRFPVTCDRDGIIAGHVEVFVLPVAAFELLWSFMFLDLSLLRAA